MILGKKSEDFILFIMRSNVLDNTQLEQKGFIICYLGTAGSFRLIVTNNRMFQMTLFRN
jgi:hypothetical protein